MKKKSREYHQLLEGAKFYLDLASASEITSEMAATPECELQVMEDSLSSEFPLFRKNAHLNSAAIRICTLYELRSKVKRHKISVKFYKKGKPKKDPSEILEDVRKNLRCYIAFLLRDSISHREVDTKGSKYKQDKQYYLQSLTPAEIESSLQQAYSELAS